MNLVRGNFENIHVFYNKDSVLMAMNESYQKFMDRPKVSNQLWCTVFDCNKK